MHSLHSFALMPYFKTFAIALLLTLFPYVSWGQIQLGLEADREVFLLYEPMVLRVKIKNISGMPIIFTSGKEKKTSWLNFIVKEGDNSLVHMDYPLEPPEKRIESGESAVLPVNVSLHYCIRSSGRYKIQAAVSLPGAKSVLTQPLYLNVANGKTYWEQKVPYEGGYRVFSLIKFKHGDLIHNYVRVEEPQANVVYLTQDLGTFNMMRTHIDPKFDADQNLHIVHPFDQNSYRYTVVSPDGAILSQEDRLMFTGRPVLAENEGKVAMLGGVSPKAKKPGRAKLSTTQDPLRSALDKPQP